MAHRPRRPGRRAAAVLGCAMWLGAPSCTTIVHDHDGWREVTPGTVLVRDSRRAGHVRAEQRAVFALFGLLPLNDGSGAELIADAAVDHFGAGVIGVSHVEIEERFTTGDVIWNTLFGALIGVRSVAASGEVHVAAGAEGSPRR